MTNNQPEDKLFGDLGDEELNAAFGEAKQFEASPDKNAQAAKEVAEEALKTHALFGPIEEELAKGPAISETGSEPLMKLDEPFHDIEEGKKELGKKGRENVRTVLTGEKAA